MSSIELQLSDKDGENHFANSFRHFARNSSHLSFPCSCNNSSVFENVSPSKGLLHRMDQWIIFLPRKAFLISQ